MSSRRSFVGAALALLMIAATALPYGTAVLCRGDMHGSAPVAWSDDGAAPTHDLHRTSCPSTGCVLAPVAPTLEAGDALPAGTVRSVRGRSIERMLHPIPQLPPTPPPRT